MEVFVARHAVLDGQKEVYAYELTFRTGFADYYHAGDLDRAEADLMAVVNFGEMTDGKRGLITFPRSLLATDFTLLLPKDKLTVQLPIDLQPDQQVLETCQKLKDAGYTLSVDDFGLTDQESPFIAFADVARVDFARVPVDRRKGLAERLAAKGIRALAKGVETEEECRQAAEWGYSYFQGEFFCRPVIRENKEIPSNKLSYLQLLKEASRPQLSYDQVEALVKRDVAMTYKLLRFMNSIWFGLRYEVNSIRQALVLLGPQDIQRWISVLAVKDLGDDKPRELLLLSLTRAKVAEQIAALVGMTEYASELFLMGVFSVIDAPTDMPMQKVLADLPINGDIKSVLLGGTTPGCRDVYDAIMAYEKGKWDLFASYAEGLKLNQNAVPPLIQKSLKWANNALNAA